MRQKLGLGSSLCLSLVMAIIAIIRISGIRLPAGEPDIIWLAFWQQQECSIAVIMVSLTAFRSLFVVDASRQVRRPKYTPSYWKKKKMAWNRHKTSSDLNDPNFGNLPAIPSATMTGLRTFIRGEPKSNRPDEAEEYDYRIPAKGHSTQETQGTSLAHVRAIEVLSSLLLMLINSLMAQERYSTTTKQIEAGAGVTTFRLIHIWFWRYYVLSRLTAYVSFLYDYTIRRLTN